MVKVAALQFQPIADHTERGPNIPGDLSVQTFPVFHGGTYVSLGFAIGGPFHSAASQTQTPERPHYPLVYISDVKDMPGSSKGVPTLLIPCLCNIVHGACGRPWVTFHEH